jgi:hypothetical protein
LAYKNFYLLNSAVLNAKSDDYEPVGFAHRIHDELTGGDCGVCHHRYAATAGDRVGVDIKDLDGIPYVIEVNDNPSLEGGEDRGADFFRNGA